MKERGMKDPTLWCVPKAPRSLSESASDRSGWLQHKLHRAQRNQKWAILGLIPRKAPAFNSPFRKTLNVSDVCKQVPVSFFCALCFRKNCLLNKIKKKCPTIPKSFSLKQSELTATKVLNTVGLWVAQNIVRSNNKLFRKLVIKDLWYFLNCPWINCLNKSFLVIFVDPIQTVLSVKSYMAVAESIFTQKWFSHLQHPNLNEMNTYNKGYQACKQFQI